MEKEGVGNQDTVTCDLFLSEDSGEPGWNQEVHTIYIYENQGGGNSRSEHTIAPNSYPSRLLQMFDVNKDGLMDIISEATGYKVVSYYEAVSSTNITNSAPISVMAIDYCVYLPKVAKVDNPEVTTANLCTCK